MPLPECLIPLSFIAAAGTPALILYLRYWQHQWLLQQNPNIFASPHPEARDKTTIKLAHNLTRHCRKQLADYSALGPNIAVISGTEFLYRCRDNHLIDPFTLKELATQGPLLNTVIVAWAETPDAQRLLSAFSGIFHDKIATHNFSVSKDTLPPELCDRQLFAKVFHQRFTLPNYSFLPPDALEGQWNACVYSLSRLLLVP